MIRLKLLVENLEKQGLQRNLRWVAGLRELQLLGKAFSPEYQIIHDTTDVFAFIVMSNSFRKKSTEKYPLAYAEKFVSCELQLRILIHTNIRDLIM